MYYMESKGASQKGKGISGKPNNFALVFNVENAAEMQDMIMLRSYKTKMSEEETLI